jgi:hypothetical protein
VGPAAGPDLKVWATRGRDGHTRIAVINKQTVPRTLVLRGSAVPAASTVTVERLTASGALHPAAGCPRRYIRTGLCATGGIRLGGRTFGVSTPGGIGGDETLSGLLGPPAPGTCLVLAACISQPPYAPRRTIVVTVPAGSATLLTGVTPPRTRRTR